jgi:hypothetical protein
VNNLLAAQCVLGRRFVYKGKRTVVSEAIYHMFALYNIGLMAFNGGIIIKTCSTT